MGTLSDFCRYCNYSSVGEYLCDPMAPDICAPCQHLLKLEAKIKDMRAALVGLEEERRRTKEQVNHSHDQLIHRFPPEIAAYIFELSIPEDVMDIDIKRPSRYTMSAPFILSAVCRRWRAIAQSTPQLWTSLPLCISDDPSSSINRAMPVTLVNQWIDRAGELPLSINLHVPNDALRSASRIMYALNQHANRLERLKYEGMPSFLPYFTKDLPQLQILHLTTSFERTVKEIFKPRPTQLIALSISANMLVAGDFDWQHLTQLVLTDYRSLTNCFEALRKAPCLRRCTFRVCPCTDTLGNDNSSQPRNRILQPKLQYLDIRDTAAACDAVLSQLVCPNLSILVLNGFTSHQPFDMRTIIALLERSKCSLERLTLLAATIAASDLALLSEGIPTLQHLNIHTLRSDRPSARSYSKALFTRLAKHSISNGTRELQYLPALRSLTWHQPADDPWSWTALLDIFGAPTARSTNHRRQMLESIAITITTYKPNDTSFDIDEETLKRILWLRDSVGVKWDLRLKENDVWQRKSIEVDILQRAVDRYSIQS